MTDRLLDVIKRCARTSMQPTLVAIEGFFTDFRNRILVLRTRLNTIENATSALKRDPGYVDSEFHEDTYVLAAIASIKSSLRLIDQLVKVTSTTCKQTLSSLPDLLIATIGGANATSTINDPARICSAVDNALRGPLASIAADLDQARSTGAEMLTEVDGQIGRLYRVVSKMGM